MLCIPGNYGKTVKDATMQTLTNTYILL